MISRKKPEAVGGFDQGFGALRKESLNEESCQGQLNLKQ
jgi:hypothetical protein